MILILAQASDMVSTKEFSPSFLAQLIQIMLLVVAILGGWKMIRRNPSLSDDVLLLREKIHNLEVWRTVTEQRLKDGDAVFNAGGADMAAMQANIETLKSDVHLMKNQMSTILINTSHHHQSPGRKT